MPASDSSHQFLQQQQMDKGNTSPDFVKKLFTMLEEQEYEHIVRWNSLGDSFIVLDTNEFTKTILPRHFKHSNFASFVRQLNKYDFHKVRQTDSSGESPYGEGAWEFKHENFQIHNKDSLDNIKRKAPVGKRGGGSGGMKEGGSGGHPMDDSPYPVNQHMHSMQHQIDELHKQQAGMNQHLHTLTKNYQTVISEMLSFQRNMVAQDQLMQNLISYMMQGPAGQPLPATEGAAAQEQPRTQEQAQKLINDYTEVAKASYEQMDAMNRRASDMGLTLDAAQNSWPQYDQAHHPQQQQQQQQQQQHAGHQQHPYDQQGNPMHGQQSYNPYAEPVQNRPLHGYDGAPPPSGASTQSYTGYQSSVTSAPGSHADNRSSTGYPPQQQQQPQTPGHPMQPSNSAQQSAAVVKREAQADGSRVAGPGMPNNAAGQAVNAIRAVQQIKQTFVPWAVPPKVLLVEDDAVCRRLSSKFLSIFGCDIDMAVDGVSAVNKMNHTKYDLVLMDIVMPNLDGVSATSLIRQFDPLTPIISMTSNVQSGDVMTYFSHGMNDILPKPFTKDGLLGMLEKHLIHLKTLKQMNTTETGPTGVSEKEAAAGSAFNLSEADYLGMLSGLMGGSVPNLRRSAEEMAASPGNASDAQTQNSDTRPVGKKQRTEEVAK